MRIFTAWLVTLSFVACMVFLMGVSDASGSTDDRETVKISWTPPDQRVNGESFDPVTEADRYEFYCEGVELMIAIEGYSMVSSYEFYKDDFFTESGEFQCFLNVVDTNELASDWVPLDKTITYSGPPEVDVGSPLDFQIF